VHSVATGTEASAAILIQCSVVFWPLTLMEERRLRVFENRVLRVFENRVLRVFENRVLRRIFGPKRDEVTAEWKKTT
jgi:uncharacterized membrane protein